MPVWHELTKDLVAKGDLVVVGITQEQHPERCALFAQWQGFDFPILWDPFNLTGLEVVPVLSAVDEHGIVRLAKPDPRRFEEQFVGEFMGGTFADDAKGERMRAFGLPDMRFKTSAQTGRRQPFAVAQLLVGDGSKETLDAAVADLLRASERSARPRDSFLAGVALRMRYDGEAARPSDFQEAAELWKRALEANPNQYIWRRRIQQWGPRLDKPYPFYDWVERATKEVAARGETPVALRVPLSGAEIAEASRAVPKGAAEVEQPDPAGKVTRDEGALVRVETAAVLHTGSAGTRGRVPRGSSRIHVVLRPEGDAGWALDADPAELWLEVPEGWTADARRVTFPMPKGDEDRAKGAPVAVDLEVSTPPVPLVPPRDGEAPADTATLSGYVVYSVCTSDGTCVFRRQDVEVVIDLPEPPQRGGDDDDDR